MGLPNLTDSGQNPADIASQIAQLVEADSNTIAGLKQSAQDDHDAIENLRTSAQSDHDAIENLLAGSNAEHYHYTSGFSNSWTAYNWTNTTTDEDGIRIYRSGVVYIVHISIQKNTGSGDVYETVLNLGTHITHPTNTVHLGNQRYPTASSSQDEYFFASNIDSNGDLNIRGYNNAGTDFIVHTSFSGMDVN